MATAKKKTAAPVSTSSLLPAQATKTRILGAAFLPEDYADLASAIGLPPGRVAWLMNHETNTLTAFNPTMFQA